MDIFTEAIEYARSGNGSYFIEAITYRYRGHSMGDPERYRQAQEVQAKQLEDPIERWGQYLLDENLATEDDLARMREEAEHEVEEAGTFARDSGWPRLLYASPRPRD